MGEEFTGRVGLFSAMSTLYMLSMCSIASTSFSRLFILAIPIAGGV
jgi:hypothetical protein